MFVCVCRFHRDLRRGRRQEDICDEKEGEVGERQHEAGRVKDGVDPRLSEKEATL